jgi:lipopolysaccharide transport system ATP-binding protein
MLNTLSFKSSSVEDFWALKNVSFEVLPGESIGIIGRNGAGKSTLLKILSKITPPTKGRIISRGRIASLLEVGTGFHPELTGRENIFFNGSLLGMKRKEIEDKFDEIVDFSGVERFLDTSLKHFSSGMQLRLAFAVAAFLEPEILIIDEVLAVGDAEFQKKCLGKMEDVSKSGRTILFVSHNIGLVQKLCNRSILLREGVLTAFESTDSVAAKYLLNSEVSDKVDLSSVARENGSFGKMVRIVECNILTRTHEPVKTLKMGEKFRVEFVIEGLQNISSISGIIGIDTPFGTEITTVASEEKGVFYTVEKNQRVTVSAEFSDLNLNPGNYILRIGLRTGHVALDLLRSASNIHVSDISDDANNISGQSIGLVGIIKSNPTWAL